MHLDYIRSFCKVVKVKSITKAAGELHLSQPAISLQINCLESRFGTKLLERTNRGVKLTGAGELVYRHGLRMLKILEILEQDLSEISSGTGRNLQISASPIYGSFILPGKMLKFIQSQPDSKPTVTIQSISEIVDNLLDQTISLGVIEGPLSTGLHLKVKDSLTSLPVGADIMRLACHKNSGLLKEYSLKDLPRIPLILTKPGCGGRGAIERGLYESELFWDDLNVILELDNCWAITSALMSGNTAGFIPQSVLNNFPELRQIPIPELNLLLNYTLMYSPNLEKHPDLFPLIQALTNR